MIGFRTTTPGREGAPLRLRAARAVFGSSPARRLFLDRQLAFWLGELDPAWSLTELRARVALVTEETHDVKTFALEPSSAWPGHRAGQYVPVEVEIDGVRVRRCYSISSAPGGARPAITVKRVKGGRVSSFLHDHVRPGFVLGLGAPAGDFVLRTPAPGKLLLLSGGSGATPVMSLLRDLSARGAVGDVVFCHAARTAADVIFRRELEELAARHAGLRLVFQLDDDPTDGGALDEAKLRAKVPDFAERETFLCGPPGMMDAVERTWARAGALDRLRSERFLAARPAVVKGAAGVLLCLSRSGRSVVAAGPGTLLEQLERAGERPAYGCRMGICQTCRSRKRTGAVQDVLTGAVSSEPDEEIRLCVSVARSDLDLAL
jgi:stearoyl-CoA 9-desaturase NADPH oxidoreductase